MIIFVYNKFKKKGFKMFNGVDRCCITENSLTITVNDGKDVYKLLGVINSKETYDIVVLKNGEQFVINKNVATTVRGLNRKLIKTSNLYNVGNIIKRREYVSKVKEAEEQRHLLAIANREENLRTGLIQKGVIKGIKNS